MRNLRAPNVIRSKASGNGVVEHAPALRIWTVTPWLVQQPGQWFTGEQNGVLIFPPMIFVEGVDQPFVAEHPMAYVERLRELQADPTVQRGPFNARIGEFLDILDNGWEAGSNG